MISNNDCYKPTKVLIPDPSPPDDMEEHYSQPDPTDHPPTLIDNPPESPAQLSGNHNPSNLMTNISGNPNLSIHLKDLSRHSDPFNLQQEMYETLDPPDVSRNPDLPPDASRNPELPPDASRNPDLPPAISRNPHLLPNASRNPELPRDVSRNPDLPPGISRNLDLPPQVSGNHITFSFPDPIDLLAELSEHLNPYDPPTHILENLVCFNFPEPTDLSIEFSEHSDLANAQIMISMHSDTSGLPRLYSDPTDFPPVLTEDPTPASKDTNSGFLLVTRNPNSHPSTPDLSLSAVIAPELDSILTNNLNSKQENQEGLSTEPGPDVYLDAKPLDEPQLDVYLGAKPLDEPQLDVYLNVKPLDEPQLDVYLDAKPLDEPQLDVYLGAKPLNEPELDEDLVAKLLDDLGTKPLDEPDLDEDLVAKPLDEPELDEDLVDKPLDADLVAQPLDKPQLDEDRGTELLDEPGLYVDPGSKLQDEPTLDIDHGTQPQDEPERDLGLVAQPLDEPQLDVDLGTKLLDEPEPDVDLGTKPLDEPRLNVNLETKLQDEPQLDVNLGTKPLVEPGLDVDLVAQPLVEPELDVDLETKLDVTPSLNKYPRIWISKSLFSAPNYETSQESAENSEPQPPGEDLEPIAFGENHNQYSIGNGFNNRINPPTSYVYKKPYSFESNFRDFWYETLLYDDLDVVCPANDLEYIRPDETHSHLCSLDGSPTPRSADSPSFQRRLSSFLKNMKDVPEKGKSKRKFLHILKSLIKAEPFMIELFVKEILCLHFNLQAFMAFNHSGRKRR